MVISRVVDRCKIILIIFSGFAIRVFAEIYPPHYGAVSAHVDDVSGVVGFSKDPGTVAPWLFFANQKIAPGGMKVFSGFNFGQSSSMGEPNNGLYLLPEEKGDNKSVWETGPEAGSCKEAYPWLPAGSGVNDFPVMLCHSEQHQDVEYGLVSSCRLSAFSAIYEQPVANADMEAVFFATSDNNESLNIEDGEVNKACRFLLMQGAQFIFSSHLVVKTSRQLTQVNCPFSESASDYLTVVAIDLSSAENCFIKRRPASGGISVHTAVVECPGNGGGTAPGHQRGGSGSESPQNAVGTGKDAGEESGVGASAGDSAAGGAGGGGGDGSDRKNPWEKFTDDEPTDLAELFIAYLRYLLSSANELERQRGIFLAGKLGSLFSSARMAVSFYVEQVELVIVRLQGGAEFGESEVLLRKAFSELSPRAKEELFVWVARAERHIQVITNPKVRPRWKYLNKKGSEEINPAVRVILEREEDEAEMALGERRPWTRKKHGLHRPYKQTVSQHQRPSDKPEHVYEDVW